MIWPLCRFCTSSHAFYAWASWNYLKFPKHGLLFYPTMLWPRQAHTLIYIWQILSIIQDPSQASFSRNLPCLCLSGRDAHALLHTPQYSPLVCTHHVLLERLFPRPSPQYVSSPLKTGTGPCLIHAGIWLTYNHHSKNAGLVEFNLQLVELNWESYSHWDSEETWAFEMGWVRVFDHDLLPSVGPRYLLQP